MEGLETGLEASTELQSESEKNRHANGSMVDFVEEIVSTAYTCYILERCSVVYSSLDAKTPFPLCSDCQNLFGQVSGSVIIDCQISINDSMSACVCGCWVCVCV